MRHAELLPAGEARKREAVERVLRGPHTRFDGPPRPQRAFDDIAGLLKGD